MKGAVLEMAAWDNGVWGHPLEWCFPFPPEAIRHAGPFRSENQVFDSLAMASG